MDDTHNGLTDTEHDEQSGDAPTKAVRRGAALIVRPGTRGVLDALRVRMRMTGLANLRVEVRQILEQDWTADTLVRAGCEAISIALDDSSGLCADTDKTIEAVRTSQSLPAGMAGRLAAIDAVFDERAELLADKQKLVDEVARLATELKAAKAQAKGKGK